jgi:predicted metallo-beta-lactamase superfamily hydrolase
MTISIELRPDEERVLRERARQSGRDVSEYVHLVLKEHIEGSKTFAEILTPVWEAFRESGMTEGQAAEFLEDALEAARREREGHP